MSIIEREPTDPAKKLLWDAADFLEAHDWTQQSYGDNNAHCLVGALHVVEGTEYKSKTPTMARARKILAKTIGVPSSKLTTWNDRRKRQKEEVIEALRKAARS